MKHGDPVEARSTTQPRGLGVGGLIALFLVFLAVFIASPVRQVSDSSYSLLVSECLLRHGTSALDRYVEQPLDPAVHPITNDGELPYHLVESGGHVTYRYPPGTSILSLPYVVVSHLFGMTAVDENGLYDAREERRMMFRLAALLMAALTVVAYLIANTRFDHRWSLVYAAAAVLTTQVWSTASRGLWSHTWAILLVLIAVLMLVRNEVLGRRLRPVLLGTVLIWAYFTRPTMAIGVALVGLYLALRIRKALVPYAATVAGWLAIFIAVSWAQYGNVLPPYYRPTKLGTTEFWTGFAGNLVSPSRGLLVFVPTVAMIVYLLIRHRRSSDLAPLALLGAGAAAGHLLVVASFPVWWGGEGYGPRLMTDAVPWLVLMAFVAIAGWRQTPADRPSLQTRVQIEAALLAVLLGVAFLMNASGALSARTNEWNWTPVSVDTDPSRVWDWQDPQFFAPFREPTSIE